VNVSLWDDLIESMETGLLLTEFLPAAFTMGIGIAGLVIFKVLADRRDNGDSRLPVFQLLLWAGGLVVLIAVIVALPLENSTRGQILSLVGVVLTAIIALSSTTFVANAMAGIMLHATKPFRPGDLTAEVLGTGRYIAVNWVILFALVLAFQFTPFKIEWVGLVVIGIYTAIYSLVFLRRAALRSSPA
jgi:hypothetical protein